MLKSVIFLLNLAEVLGGIVVAPSNTIVRVGEKLFLECRTNNESKVRKWTHYSTSRISTNIYRHPDVFHANFRHFDIQVDAAGSGVIRTNSTRPDDAGIYGCNARVDGKEETFTAHVVVIESLPQCLTNLTTNAKDSLEEGVSVRMQCSVTFRGFWTPTMEWRQHSRDGNISRKLTERDGVELVSFDNSRVFSTLTFVINSSMNDAFISWRFYFIRDNGKDPNVTATNIPTYSYNWSSDVITLPTSVMESTVNTFKLNASLSPVALDTDSNSSQDWYVISFSSVSALSLFLVLVVIVSTAFCIHYKKIVSAKYATMAATSVKLDSPSTDIYEIPPYSVEGNYETIDETEIGNDSSDQQIPDTYPTPAAGYSALLPTAAPTTPPVYSKVQINDESSFNRGENRSNLAHFGKKAEETNANRTEEGQDPLSYLEIIGTASERNSPDEDIAKPTLMPVTADIERKLVYPPATDDLRHQW